MSIEDVFNPGEDCSYIIDTIVPGIPKTVAGNFVVNFLTENPHGIVWAFYQRLWMPIKEGIILDGGNFHRSCSVGDLALLSGTVPAHKLFPDVGLLYIQLCSGQPPRGIGFVEKRFGPEVFTTEVGHYKF